MKRTVFIIVAALVALGAAFILWRTLIYPHSLPFEQKIQRGYLRIAYEEATLAATSAPNPENLSRLLRVLTLRGNAGRALVLSRIYGITVPTVEAVGDFQERVLDEVNRTGSVRNHFAAGKLSEVRRFPIYANLKFFVGYQCALLGDWNAARDYFAQAERDGVSPELAPYLKYYLARALIIKGDETEKRKGRKMLSSLLKPTDPYHLNARVLLNQLNLAIKDRELSKCPWFLERIRRPHNRWEYAKALNDLGAAFLDRQEPEKALPLFAQALLEKSVFGSEKASVDGMCAALIGGGATPQSTTASHMPDAIYRLSELITGSDWSAKATANLRQIADDSTYDRKVRGAALAGIARMGIEAAAAPSYPQLAAQAQKLSPTGPWTQLVRLNYARHLAAQGKRDDAERQYQLTAKTDGPHSADALFEQYRLLEAKEGFWNISAKIRILEELTQKTSSIHFLEAAEELIPLYLYERQRAQAGALAHKVEDADTSVAAYWQRFLRNSSTTDEERLPRGTASSQIKRFSYYEVASISSLTADDIEPANRIPTFQRRETPEEFLAGIFATDLALSVAGAKDLSELPPMAAAVAIHSLEISRPRKVSSWAATELVESGRLHNQPVLPYVLEAAYPRPYPDAVRAAAERYGVEPALVYAVMKKESNFREDAVSPSGAVGLMQLMPATAALFESRLPPELQPAPLTDPRKSIHLGAAYLASLRDALGADYLVLAAYNAGPGTLKAWREQMGRLEPELFVNLIPSAETETFVKKTLKYKKIYEFLLHDDTKPKVQVE